MQYLSVFEAVGLQQRKRGIEFRFPSRYWRGREKMRMNPYESCHTEM